MKYYKNKQALKLMIALLSFNSIVCAMNVYARRSAGPAIQSGLRSFSGLSGNFSSVPQNISIPIGGVGSSFKQMPYQRVSYTENTIPSQLSYDVNKLIQSWDGYQDQNDSSRQATLQDNNSSWQAWMLGFFGAAMAVAKQRTYADKEQEEVVDASELLDKNSLDARLYPELAKFIRIYSCPADLDKRAKNAIWAKKYMRNYSSDSNNDYQENQRILEQNPILKKSNYFNEHRVGRNGFSLATGELFDNTVSEFFVKGSEIDRIINAERMKKYLKENKLHNFDVASECLTHHDNALSVISSKINIGNQDKKLSLVIVQQMVKIAEDTGYCDWQLGANVMQDVHNKFIFVDNENFSYGPSLHDFPDSYSQDEKRLMMYSKIFRIRKLIEGIRYFMSDDAATWIEAQANEYENLANIPNSYQEVTSWESYMKKMLIFLKRVADIHGEVIPLSENTQYDAAIGIDFEKVKQQFKQFQDAQIKEVD